MDYNKKVGARIKEARLKADLTLEELGAKVGLTKSTVTKYERGEIKTLDISKIKEFAKVLRVDSNYLACWDDEEPEIKTVAAHAIEDLTDDEIDEVLDFIRFQKMKRQNQNDK